MGRLRADDSEGVQVRMESWLNPDLGRSGGEVVVRVPVEGERAEQVVGELIGGGCDVEDVDGEDVLAALGLL